MQGAAAIRSARLSSPWLIAGIIGAAVILRLAGNSTRWFWLDELLTVNWSVHGVWPALVNVTRFDTHPPLYYLQLSLWALAGHSDPWLVANAVLWSTAAVGLLIYAVARIHGLTAGMRAGLLLAISPAALSYSDSVRMYSFLMFLTIWAWYAQEKWLAKNQRRRAVWMIVSQICVVYSHAAGLVELSGIVLYGAARLLIEPRTMNGILRWLAIETAVLVLSLPALAIAVMRGVTHPIRPGFAEILGGWAWLGSGIEQLSPIALTIGACLLIYLAVLAVFERGLLVSSATLIFGPIITFAVLSYVFRPMWLLRGLVPVVPFLCMNLAVGSVLPVVNPAIRRFQTFGLTALVVAWSAAGVLQQFTREKGDGYRPAAELVHSIEHPGDTILIEGDYNYWCFNWYYIGPNWGEPRHAFTLNADWTRMMNRLPASASSLLGLSGADRTLKTGETIVRLWNGGAKVPEAPGDLIVVWHQSDSQPTLPGRKLVYTRHVQQLYVQRWTSL